MSPYNRPSLEQIKAAHGPKIEYERYLFASRFVFRPLSFPAIWLLVRLGVSSEKASWCSGLAALAGFACWLWPGKPLLWSGIGLLLLFNFMDCVDGGIARATFTRNPYGRFLDAVMYWVDMVFWAMVGLLVWRMPAMRLLCLPAELYPAAGALSAFSAAYAVYLEGVFDLVLREHWDSVQGTLGAAPRATPLEGTSGPGRLARVLFFNLRVRETHYLLLAAAAGAGAADVLLVGFVVVNAVFPLLLLAVYCRRGRIIFQSGRGREPQR